MSEIAVRNMIRLARGEEQDARELWQSRIERNASPTEIAEVNGRLSGCHDVVRRLEEMARDYGVEPPPCGDYLV